MNGFPGVELTVRIAGPDEEARLRPVIEVDGLVRGLDHDPADIATIQVGKEDMNQPADMPTETLAHELYRTPWRYHRRNLRTTHTVRISSFT